MSPDRSSVVDHTAQTRYSDPGDHASLFDEVEPTVAHVSSVARNVVAHYRAFESSLPASTRGDVSLRWVESILDADQQRHQAPLAVDRPLQSRVQGCCRDHTLLSIAVLRHHGVAARSRVGFADYLSDGSWHHDHVIVEAWLDGRWRRFDPELAPALGRLDDPTDIPLGPESPFLSAAEVWQGHRTGSLDVSTFGVAEGLGICGDWFVYGYVIAQVAHRFGDELLLWDQWGAMHGDLSTAPQEHLELVDEVADLLVRADDGDLVAETELLARYRADDRLHPGPTIHSVSPHGGFFEVDLDARTSRQMS